MLPKNLEKTFRGAINSSSGNRYAKHIETKEERLERIMQQLGIEKHGKGKRKKNKKKKGGKK